MDMKIFIGADHAGFELKQKLIPFLRELEHEVEDKGAFEFNTGDDYPDFITPVAREVASDPERSRGIIIGGSGQGEAMEANRFKGIRAAVYYGFCVPQSDMESGKRSDLEIVRLSREHNNSNVLSLGARFLSEEEAKSAVKLWLETPFSEDERHVRRLLKIDKLTANS